MNPEFVSLPYKTKPIRYDELTIAKAVDFVRAVDRGNYAQLICCERMEGSDELVYFEIEPEIGQDPIVDIRYKERLVVQFIAADLIAPWVYALREDFPYVIHLNAMEFEKPRCLCLYETSYEELKRSWRGNGFLERIREWLGLTAQNKLHHKDQPLESFMINTIGNIVLPAGLNMNEEVNVYRLDKQNSKLNLSAFRAKKKHLTSDNKFFVLHLKSEPQVHGYLRKTPTNMMELDELLQNLGVDFIEGILKPKLNELKLIERKEYHEHKIIVLLTVPKKRYEDDKEVINEITTFITLDSIRKIALATNTIIEEKGVLGHPIPSEHYVIKETAKLLVGPLRTYWMLTKESALYFSGLERNGNNDRIGLIGVGALGSQVISILSRMGFGTWKILDKDILLTHNIVRHSLRPEHTSYSKSEMVAAEVNQLLNDITHCCALHDDYLKPKSKDAIVNYFSDVNLIIDASTSVAVARKLAYDIDLKARRISTFLNPQGTDLVMLVEPKDRSIRLDHLEMQYYRLIWQTNGLGGHLLLDGQPIRYSASCRDITSTIKQEDVVTLAGICAKAIRNHIGNKNGKIMVWKGCAEGAITYLAATAYPIYEYKVGEWTITIDEFVLSKIKTSRGEKLPNETGGVLLGSYDQVTKAIFVLDTILSPKDSSEFPNAYYRGIDGLEDKLQALSEFTGHNLMYIGEWHSHSDKCSVKRSDDDMILFNWIREHMDSIGLPPLMLIVGDKDKLGVYT